MPDTPRTVPRRRAALRRRAAVLVVASLAGACGGPDGAGDRDANGGDAKDGAPSSAERAPAPAPSRRLAPVPAPERTEVVGAFWNGRVVTLGGLHLDSSASAQVDLYDPGTDTWVPGPALPVAVHHAGAGVLDGRLYVVGGYAGPDWSPIPDVYSLGPAETAWRKEPFLAGPRGALAVASLPDALVAVGGTGDGGLVRTEILGQGASAWRPGPDLETQREHLAATGAGGRAYAIAGRVATLESNRDSVESLGPAGTRWKTEPKLNHTRGGIGAATLARGVPCVAGGEEPGGPTVAPVECLLEGAWMVVAQLEVPRHGVAVVAAGDTLHVLGGGRRAGLFVSDVHEAFDL